EHQRAAGIGGFGSDVRSGRGDPAGGGQLAAPGVGVGPRDVMFGAVVHEQLRRGRTEAGVALGDGERRQRGGGEHAVGRGRVEWAQALRERVVDGAEGAGADEGIEEGRGHRGPSPWSAANSRSSACTSSGAKRSWYTPGRASPRASSSMPRQNR